MVKDPLRARTLTARSGSESAWELDGKVGSYTQAPRRRSQTPPPLPLRAGARSGQRRSLSRLSSFTVGSPCFLHHSSSHSFGPPEPNLSIITPISRINGDVIVMIQQERQPVMTPLVSMTWPETIGANWKPIASVKKLMQPEAWVRKA